MESCSQSCVNWIRRVRLIFNSLSRVVIFHRSLGLTGEEIVADGFEITKKIEILMSSDTPVGVAKSMGIGLIEFGPALAELNPDFVMVLGDRFELLAVAAAALVLAIPIAHIHGGETTRGRI